MVSQNGVDLTLSSVDRKILCLARSRVLDESLLDMKLASTYLSEIYSTWRYDYPTETFEKSASIPHWRIPLNNLIIPYLLYLKYGGVYKILQNW